MGKHDNIDKFLVELAKATDDLDRDVGHAVAASGVDVMNFAKSHTSEMRPPVREGEGERAAHPGRWADDTGELIGTHTSEYLKMYKHIHRVFLRTNMEYDEALEQMDGFSVLDYLIEGGHATKFVEARLKEINDVRRVV